MTIPQNKWGNLASIVRAHAQERSNETAYTYLIDGEDEKVEITFGELDAQARTFAATLQKISKPGDRALLLYPSGLEFIVAFLGCLYAGVVAAPTTVPHLKRSTPRLKLMMENAKANIACTTQGVYDKIKLLLDENPEFSSIQWIISEHIENGISKEWTEFEIQPNNLAFLQYTSGSTSAPKGVMISNFNLLRTIEDSINGSGFEKDSIMVSWLPIFHDMGLVYCLLVPLYMGRPCIFMSPISFLEKPVRWLQTISKYGATHTAAPNFAYDLCTTKVLDHEKHSLDLGTLRFTANAAEPVRLETMQEFAEAFKNSRFNYDSFSPSYGLAEVTVMVCGKTPGRPPTVLNLDISELEKNRIVLLAEDQTGYKFAGCGWSTINADIKIVNSATGQIAAADEIGEIWIQSDSVAQGYWQNPEASSATFEARITGYDGGPFLRTGDMGFAYKEDLYIVGRIKDMIILQGKNYYPQDLELTVEKCHPALRPSCGAAFAVQGDQIDHLVIVQEIKREFRKSENFKEIADAIRMAVAKNHGLRVQAVVLIMPSTISKTTSGKIQRSATRDMFLSTNLEALYEWRAPGIFNTLISQKEK